MIRLITKNELLFHLLQLNDSDRYLRFLSISSDENIKNYVDMISNHDILLGFCQDGKIVSAIHACIKNEICEFGISTLFEYRGKGYAKKTLDKLFSLCYELKIKQVTCVCLRSNQWMLKIAKNYFMKLNFDSTECWAERIIN